MRVPLRLLCAAPLLLMGPGLDAATSASFGTNIRLEVPIVCKLVHRGEPAQEGNSYNLGQLFEYCNAPTGFLVQLDYQPGTLRGAVLQVGDKQVMLDGSGETEIMRSNGPKISTLDVTGTAGADGLDPGALQFQIVPL
jgi:hypothetical protein